MEELLRLIRHLAKKISRSLKLMEVCGTHTSEIFKHGLRDLLPKEIHLLSGPGCPVCVTSKSDIDSIIEVSQKDDIILTTFGDMMRVPGNFKSLSDVKAEGAQIKVIYSPMQSLEIARANKYSKVVFLSTGFETTAPLTAATIEIAEKNDIKNFYIYPLNKLLPPALRMLLVENSIAIDGFILPGHVSTIIGADSYHFISTEYFKPAVITGFSLNDILIGIVMLLKQIYEQRAEIEVQYLSAVKKGGNKKALSFLWEYFSIYDAFWRGLGLIRESGLTLKEKYESRNIKRVYAIKDNYNELNSEGCMCGEVLKGLMMPNQCKLFYRKCTPINPVGACMVSTEGSCAIYYKYFILSSKGD